MGLFTGWRSRIAALTFQGKRNVSRALGYKTELGMEDYRLRFERNEVANRIVKALPYATWRGGFEVVDDEDPKAVSPFEKAFIDLDNRLKIADKLRRGDVVSGIGAYGIIVMGTPGKPEEELTACKPEELVFLQPYAQDHATITKYETDRKNPRYGQPVIYSVSTTNVGPGGAGGTEQTVQVHHSRVLHMGDGLLENNIYSEPRLRCVWNRLDDLDKVAGGGAEAFWMRANPGTQFDLDPELEFSEEQKAALKAEILEYEHGGKRTLFTRGVEMKVQDGGVADIAGPVGALMSLISAGARIPQRVLMGSEQGKLAAKQDAANWNNQVTDRQNDYANPLVARVLIDRFVALGILPKPIKDTYKVYFNTVATQDPEQRLDTASKMAGLNKAKIVVTVDEIRAVLGLPPLSIVDPKAEELNNAPPPAPSGPGGFGGDPARKVRKPKAAAGKGGASWESVHQAADRFRWSGKAGLLRQYRGGEGRDQ